MVLHHAVLTYGLLTGIIFCETGLVVTPILPGDSIIFTVGALSAQHFFNLPLLIFLLSLAAILGDTINYRIGYSLGPKVFHQKNSKWLNPEYLKRTHQFYEKHGGKTILLGRFIPIIRTFVPFVAGIGRMRYFSFWIFNAIGGLLWISLGVLGGYFFGNLPMIQNNFSLFLLGIVLISLIPVVLEVLKTYQIHHR
jgi:membrane-associated protein